MKKFYILCLALLIQCAGLSFAAQAEEMITSEEAVTYTVKGHDFVASKRKMSFSAAQEFCTTRNTLLKPSRSHKF